MKYKVWVFHVYCAFIITNNCSIQEKNYDYINENTPGDAIGTIRLNYPLTVHTLPSKFQL